MKTYLTDCGEGLYCRKIGGFETLSTLDSVRCLNSQFVSSRNFRAASPRISHRDREFNASKLSLLKIQVSLQISRRPSGRTRAHAHNHRLRADYLRLSELSATQKDHTWGYPILCDFGKARIGGGYAYEEIQPEVHKQQRSSCRPIGRTTSTSRIPH